MFPADENGDVLRRMAEHGDELRTAVQESGRET